MKIFCFHCECWHVPGDCAYTVKPKVAFELQQPGESDSVYFRRLYQFLANKASDGILAAAKVRLPRQSPDDIKASDCVFLWSCGIRVDSDVLENKGNKGVDKPSPSL